VSIIAEGVWIAAEAYLIRRDHVRGKGTTTIDRKTRIYNTISLAMAVILSPIICWLPIFRFAGIGSPIVFWIGIVIVCLALLLRHWSIHVLGRYFRTTVEIEKGHKVIQTGPYKYIRHPSYSAIIVFCIGYGLIAQNWLSLIIAVSIPTISLLYRIKIEEAALIRGIGTEYKDYQKKTKRLIPGIW
jgi:protein-S-isoprenylcysteine O-methyltransferase Ste14